MYWVIGLIIFNFGACISYAISENWRASAYWGAVMLVNIAAYFLSKETA